MTRNPKDSNIDPNNDPFLIQEDAEIFGILIPSTTKRLSKFEEVSGLIAFAQYSLQKHQFVVKY